VDVIHYGTKGKPGDWWKPVVFKIADTSSTTVDVDLPAEGGTVTVRPRIGDTFGGYALILDLGERPARFAATCVRVPKPEPAACGCQLAQSTLAGRTRCRRWCSTSSRRLA